MNNNNNLIYTKVEDEFRVFFSIKKIRELLNYDQIINRRTTNNINKDELIIFKRILQYNYSQLPRYGVHLNFNLSSNNYELNDDFYSWFDFWNAHLNNMSTTDLLMFERTYSNKEPLDKFYPETSWQDIKESSGHTINLINEQ